MLETTSDIAIITATHDLIADLEQDMRLAEVAIELAELYPIIDLCETDKEVADVIRDLCKRSEKVKEAIVQKLKPRLDNFLSEIYDNGL